MLNNFGVPVAAASGVKLKVNHLPACPAGNRASRVSHGGTEYGRPKKIDAGKKNNQGRTGPESVNYAYCGHPGTDFAKPVIMLFDPVSTDVIEDGILYLRGYAAGKQPDIYRGHVLHLIPFLSEPALQTLPWSMPCWTRSLSRLPVAG